jgi:nucleoside 2-deoxyribosyltransferase
MAYKVFVSHSTRDQGLVMALTNILSKFGVEVSVGKWYLVPDQNIPPRDLNKIKNSDCVVALLTPNGIRSKWVQQEIGYALNAKKPLIPLVEKGMDPKELGALQDKDYIEYDPRQPNQALIKTSTFVKTLKLKKVEREKASLVAGGVVAFLLLLLLSGEGK